MGFKIRRYRKQAIHKDIEGLIRTFPSIFVSIERAGYSQDALSEQMKIYTTIWRGEALVRRVTGTVQRLPSMQIETGTISLLIVGQHDFREGDYVGFRDFPNWALNHPAPALVRFYQVQRVSDAFSAFTTLELNLTQQQVPWVYVHGM